MGQAREFDQKQGAEQWIAATFGPWRASLSTAEVIALAAYKGSDYVEINGTLRGHRPLTDETELVIASIDRAIARMRLPEPVIAWRAIGSQRLATWTGDLTGVVIEEHGYASTSLLRATAEDFLAEVVPPEHGLIERIWLPGGTHVAVQAAAPDLVRDLGECELLLPHGTLLRVTADHGHAHPYRSIDVEVIVE